jgi:hypothetical protein
VNTNHTLANNKEKHINYGNQYNTSETKENYRRIDIQSTQCANILLGPDSLLDSYHFSTQNPILKVVLGSILFIPVATSCTIYISFLAASIPRFLNNTRQMANTLHFYILSIKSKEMGNIIGFTNNIL